MLQLENKTPFEAGIHLFPNREGIDTLYVALKATFSIASDTPVLSEEQVPLQLGDEHWGEPADSSIKFSNEAHLSKVGTDVVLVGAAQQPNARPTHEVMTSLSVGALRKQVRVFGDREWTGRRIGRRISPPERFEKMPLVWERAFGGVHVKDAEKGKIYTEPRNPVGRGFRGKRSTSELTGALLPNLEDPAAPLSSPGDVQVPSCFGFVSPSWAPRVAFAGTYDEAWQSSRAPFLPSDFDPRFFSAAPEGLSSLGFLQGGEPVELIGVSERGPLRFRLPRCHHSVEIRRRAELATPALGLETVLFEPEADRFSMLWRAEFVCGKDPLAVESIRIETDSLALDGGQGV